MVAIDLEKGIALYKPLLGLKSLLVVLQDGEDVELPQFLAVAEVDVVGALFVVMVQGGEVVFFRKPELIPALAVALVQVREDDKGIVL